MLMGVVLRQNQGYEHLPRGTTMRPSDRLKALRDKLDSETRHDPDQVQRDDTDSSAASIANRPPDSISASVADLDAAGFPPDLR
jgi:hypothetical protein